MGFFSRLLHTVKNEVDDSLVKQLHDAFPSEIPIPGKVKWGIIGAVVAGEATGRAIEAEHLKSGFKYAQMPDGVWGYAPASMVKDGRLEGYDYSMLDGDGTLTPPPSGGGGEGAPGSVSAPRPVGQAPSGRAAEGEIDWTDPKNTQPPPQEPKAEEPAPSEDVTPTQAQDHDRRDGVANRNDPMITEVPDKNMEHEPATSENENQTPARSSAPTEEKELTENAAQAEKPAPNENTKPPATPDRDRKRGEVDWDDPKSTLAPTKNNDSKPTRQEGEQPAPEQDAAQPTGNNPARDSEASMDSGPAP